MPGASLLCPPWPSPRSFPPPGFCPGLSLCQDALTCFSCFFPQGSCFLGGLALCLVRLTYEVPVLRPSHSASPHSGGRCGDHRLFSSSAALPYLGAGGGGTYACSTRLQGGSPFLGLWPFVNEEEKAHYCIWRVFRCARLTCKTGDHLTASTSGLRPGSWDPQKYLLSQGVTRKGLLNQTKGIQWGQAGGGPVAGRAVHMNDAPEQVARE